LIYVISVFGELPNQSSTFNKRIPPINKEIATVTGFSKRASIFLANKSPKTTAGINATRILK